MRGLLAISSSRSDEMPQAAYLHIPFCAHKCAFCDFAAFAGVDELEKEYCDTLMREIEDRLSGDSGQSRLTSVFYGGGTPGYISPQNLRRVHDTLRKHVCLADDAEVTLETTPHAITGEKLDEWKDIGVNRLSIGVESLSDDELQAMGRDHTRRQALEGIALAAESGIASVCIDFMYGLPTQTLDSWKATLNQAEDLAKQYMNLNHVSAYGLHLADNSPLYSKFPRGSDAYPTDDLFADMFFLLVERLEEAGFAHYEVSNFARAGFQSRHNLNYWKNSEYLAFGVSAHRYLRPVRSANWRSLKRYMRDWLGSELNEVIDPKTELKEAIMLALRTRRGIDLAEFKEVYGVEVEKKYASIIGRLIGQGHISLADGRLFLPLEAFPVSNRVIAEFF